MAEPYRRYTPTELTELEKARVRASRSAIASLSLAFHTQDAAGAVAAIRQVNQIDLDHDRVINSLHLPGDAGPWAEGLTRIMLRIPDGRGRWVSVTRGWYPIVTALADALADLDSDYVIRQVKEKFGCLVVYYSPCTEDEDIRRQMRELVDAAVLTAECTCAECGIAGDQVSLRRDRYVIATLCGICAAARTTP